MAGPRKRSKCGDAVDDAVGADLGGVIGEDGQAGAGAGLDEDGLDVEVEIDGAAQGGVEWRHYGGDDYAGDRGHVDIAQREELTHEHAELVDGDLAAGGDAPVGEQLGGGLGRGFGVREAVEAEDGVGVAYIDG